MSVPLPLLSRGSAADSLLALVGQLWIRRQHLPTFSATMCSIGLFGSVRCWDGRSSRYSCPRRRILTDFFVLGFRCDRQHLS